MMLGPKHFDYEGGQHRPVIQLPSLQHQAGYARRPVGHCPVYVNSQIGQALVDVQVERPQLALGLTVNPWPVGTAHLKVAKIT